MEQPNRIINVAGDYVQSKHVDYEINNVEAGGIGIQIVNNSQPTTNPPQSKPITPKKSPHFLETPTFIYRYFQSDPNSNQRIHLLYKYLCKEYKETKTYIDPNTPSDHFFSLFTGERNNRVIRWAGDKQDLSYFIKQLLKRNIIALPQGMTVWTITQNHFSDYHGNYCADYRSQHAPSDAHKAAIERFVDILDPTAMSTTELTELSRKLSDLLSGK